ncbi:hypothetical protein [aff. Roholtiella sp. LEGE 12411]|uniref:hypothetical protein n=1 Tax=aff. Roholtiella sp. LEGE 12411 TaxID=1828822 RepID=UPI00187F7A14|nr:hypothetical protein [aff. Roholtiella sp. LEGE 12411]
MSTQSEDALALAKVRSQNLQILPGHLAINYLTGNACAGNVYIVPKSMTKLTALYSK